MLNVVQHTSQHLQEMLPSKTAKTEFLHKIAMAAVDHHQVKNAILGNLEAIKIHVRRTRRPKICQAKVVNLHPVKAGKEGCSIIRASDGTTTHLKLRRGSRKWTYIKIK